MTRIAQGVTAASDEIIRHFWCATLGKTFLVGHEDDGMNWRDIGDRLKHAVHEAVGELLRCCGDQQLYAIALFTADDGISVSMAANTEEGYQSHLDAEAEDEPNTPEDEAYYR